MEDEKFRSARFNCDTGILWTIHSNRWKYLIFDIEIFTFFIEGEELWKINMNFL